MAFKKFDKRSDGVANTLKLDEITTIIATAEALGAREDDLKLIKYDLVVPKFRVFDWLAMAIDGRLQNKNAVKVFVHSFLKVNGDVDKFIKDLRESDYDCDRSWQRVAL